MTKFTTKLILAAALAASASTAAQAQTQTPSRLSISVADIDLATPAGQQQLLRRIDHAAKQVCGYRADTRDMGIRQTVGTCVTKAKTTAIQQAGSLRRGDFAVSVGD